MSVAGTVLIIHPEGDVQGWRKTLAQELPEFNVEIWPEYTDAGSVAAIICWNHPAGVLARFPNLKIIMSFGAGIDHIVSDPALPRGVPIAAVLTPRMIQEMVRYVVQATLDHALERPAARQAQCSGRWQRTVGINQHAEQIVILGAGKLGIASAHALKNLGFPVRVWTRSASNLKTDLEIHRGWESLENTVQGASILICMLPLAKETTGIINAAIFAKLAPHAAFINVGRGKQVVEADLKSALQGNLSAAYLDVWEPEPPPADSWIWSHPKVFLTPHIAARTDRPEAAKYMAQHIRNSCGIESASNATLLATSR